MKEFYFNKKRRLNRKHVTCFKNGNTNPYLREVEKLKKTIPEWDSFFESSEVVRGNNWIRLTVLGQPLCHKFSWAIPDERSLNILSYFSPLIEIGAGNGYWARLLRDRGVSILAFDKTINHKDNWTTVKRGGPQVLCKQIAYGRALFLCYPDDSQNLALKCLRRFSGDIIIHVGELLQTGTLSGYPQAPFGRTSSSDFNVELSETFHCLLSASIPRFPFSNDCITVWKRTQFVHGRERDDMVNKSGDADRDLWASIPSQERLPVNIAAPCFEHLLEI